VTYKNINAGADIHAGDGGYGIGTRENYEAFVRKREWRGLTDYEIGVCSTEAAINRNDMVGGAIIFAKSIEAKLKEKNT
jgi:hypothetical protein